MYFLLSLVFLTLIFVFQKKLHFAFGDHHPSIGLIEGIKRQGNRFVRTHPNYIGDRHFAYPQLFHWLLSFLPQRVYTRHYNALNYSISLSSFLLIVALVHPLFWEATGRGLDDLGLFGLAFITTPFLWLPWNAKNLGISARVPGTTIGIVYSLLLLQNTLHFSYVTLAILVLLCIVSILLSQFTTQFILFYSVALSIAFLELWYISIPVASFLLLAVAAPRFTRNYFIGQFTHKYIYAKYLAPEYVLSGRYSIWLDFIRGIPEALRKDWKSGLIYVYTNPLFLLLWAIPFQTFMFFHFGDDGRIPLQKGIRVFALCGLALFILFSFRKTRFLGEPERYVESLIPLHILYFFSNPSFDPRTATWFILYSLLCISMLFFIEYRSGTKTTKHRQDRLDHAFESFVSKYGDSVSLVSNNWHVMRRFCSTPIRTLTPSFFTRRLGSLPLELLFKNSFLNLDPGCLEAVTGEFKLDYCIVDLTGHGSDAWIERLKSHGLQEVDLGQGYSCFNIAALASSRQPDLIPRP